MNWRTTDATREVSDCGHYELRTGYGPNYHQAFFDGQLIAASSDKSFVLRRIETHKTQRKAA